MIITLSPKSIANAKANSHSEGKHLNKYIENVLEILFRDNSAYFVLTPTPSIDKLRAIAALANHITNVPEFYGYKLLTKEECEAEIERIQKEQAFDTTQSGEAQEIDELASEPKTNVLAFPTKETVQ